MIPHAYVAMDGEFSGLDHTRHELISVGFCECYNPTNTFYLEIQPTKPMNPQATSIHKLTRKHLMKNGIQRREAAFKIRDYLRSFNAKKLIFVGYPVFMDFLYLDLLFKEFGIENEFYYEQMDTHTSGVQLLGLEPGFSHSELRRRLGLPKVPSENKHHALLDCRHQAEEFVALMDLAERMRNASARP